MAAIDLLAMHADLTRLMRAAPRSSAVAARARAVRAVVARLALAHAGDLSAGADPLAAVRRVVALAAEATGDWPAVIAAVNQASMRREA